MGEAYTSLKIILRCITSIGKKGVSEQNFIRGF